MSNSQQRFFVGMDGGGTKIKLKVADDSGKVLSQAQAGPAQIGYSVILTREIVKLSILVTVLRGTWENHCLQLKNSEWRAKHLSGATQAMFCIVGMCSEYMSEL